MPQLREIQDTIRNQLVMVRTMIHYPNDGINFDAEFENVGEGDTFLRDETVTSHDELEVVWIRPRVVGRWQA